MQLELVSHPLCPFVHRAAIMLVEKGVPFTRRDIDLKNKPDWFLAISPRGKVPVLVANGEPIFESSVIVEFLDEMFPPKLLPEDPLQRARQRAWVEVANDLLAAQYALFTASADEVFEKMDRVAGITSRLEGALANGRVDPEGFGLVHVAFAPALHRFVIVEEALRVYLLESTPLVSALARRLSSRRSVTSTVAHDFPSRFLDSLADGGSNLARAA